MLCCTVMMLCCTVYCCVVQCIAVLYSVVSGGAVLYSDGARFVSVLLCCTV